MSLNSWEGDVFVFGIASPGVENEGAEDTPTISKELGRVVIQRGQPLYYMEDSECVPDPRIMDIAAKEQQYMEEYYRKSGDQWRHFYGEYGPRPEPKLHMWPSEFVGQTHTVSSSEGQWQWVMRNGELGVRKETESKDYTIRCVSTQPKAFIIENLLSDYECSTIVNHSQAFLQDSLVGDIDGAGGVKVSKHRTSRNAWMRRDTNHVSESVYRRAADILKIKNAYLWEDSHAEPLQVVHYKQGQKYDAHYDFVVGKGPHSRFLTLLLYLTDQPHESAGGETAFPKASVPRVHDSDGPRESSYEEYLQGLDNMKGFKVHPGKGSAVLFYNLKPDGNGDDDTLHAALPVLEGEKWLANMWVWDPKLPQSLI